VGTATATAVGTAPFAPPLDGGSFGFDFNPTVDRIRVVSLTRQNLRLNQNDGTATLDGRLAYAPTDAAAAATPIVVGSAYTNPVAGATATQLFGIDVGRNSLVLQNPPNPGTLATVGALGVNATSPVGFDITPANGTAYATFRGGHAWHGALPDRSHERPGDAARQPRRRLTPRNGRARHAALAGSR